MKRLLLVAICFLSLGSGVYAFEQYCYYWPLPPDPGVGDYGGRAKISGQTAYKGSPVDVYFSQACAGCITKIVWDGFEYVNSWGAGGLYQANAYYGGAGTCDNPVHGGDADGRNYYGVGSDTSTELLSFGAYKNTAQVAYRGIYWRPKGFNVDLRAPECHGHAALVGGLSTDVNIENVDIGNPVPNMIKFDATFLITNPHNSPNLYEYLAAFSSYSLLDWYLIDVRTGALTGPQPIPHGGFIQTIVTNSTPWYAAIGSTTDGSHAIGFLVPQMDFDKYNADFTAYYIDLNRPQIARNGDPCCGNKETKNHCQAGAHGPLAVGDALRFTCYMVFGSLADVQSTITSVGPGLPFVDPLVFQ